MRPTSGSGSTTSDTGAAFGEDQARYLLAVKPDNVAELLARLKPAGVPAENVGTFGGPDISFRRHLRAAQFPVARLSFCFRREGRLSLIQPFSKYLGECEGPRPSQEVAHQPCKARHPALHQS